MAEFAYQALGKKGQRSQGILTAISEREAMTMLDAQGLFPVSIQAAKSAQGSKHWRRRIRSRYVTPSIPSWRTCSVRGCRS